jgi:P-type Ca2+ transporter type 2C
MLGGGQNTIPSINITTELPSDSPSHSHHVLSSSLLSPHSPAHGPPSPVLSDLSDSASVWNPPSPTLSNHSGPFPSTLQLRDNKPEEKSGLSSLDLLNPDSFGRRDRGSTSTSLTDVARSDDVHHAHSNTTSVTNVDQISHSPTNEIRVSYDPKAAEKKPEKGKKPREIDDIEEDDGLQTAHQIELAQDAAIDPSPFRFKPYELAHMLDPKNIGTLVGFGGIDGLLRGLGTNADTGLVTNNQHAHSLQNSHSFNLGAGEDAPQEPNPGAGENSNGGMLPVIVLTKPNETLSENDKLVFSATLEDRRRVYGENVLPTRITKTLLQLMWTALKDKVLVSNSLAVCFSAHSNPLDVDPAIDCCCHFLSTGIFPRLWSLPKS